MKRNDGLVLLYDAAMLLEQHSLGPIGPIPIVNANQSFSSHGIVKRSSKTVEERAHGLTRTASQPLPQSFRTAPGFYNHNISLTGITAASMPIVSMATDPTLQLRPNNYWSLASTSTIAAATASSASTYSPSPTKQRLSATTIRTSHNELEKIRRAKLRISIDQLKSRLPALRGRVTMLTVLKRACAFVKDLEQKSEEQRAQLRQLERRRMELKMRRGQLTRLLRRLKKQAADAAGVSSTYNVSEAAKSFGAKKLRPLTSAMPSVESGDKSSFKAAVASSKQPSSVTGLSWLGSASNADDSAAYRKLVRCPIPYKSQQTVAVAAAAAAGSVNSPDSGYVSPQNAPQPNGANR
ncbi:hypothetical protein BOX15_Mlig032558g1 [Macrostomum lignano]|uniref:BHLH domain-containing protein n=1 Tax=Macrostomum lignano TaxID=282301 RepID=A0A267H6J6_9PLAT|nr:hypothetical protein BOX15_Mlig032558g1 [Macrostomum lignano]